MLESDFFDIFAYLIYACVIVLLIATIFLAPNIKDRILGSYWDLSVCNQRSWQVRYRFGRGEVYEWLWLC